MNWVESDLVRVLSELICKKYKNMILGHPLNSMEGILYSLLQITKNIEQTIEKERKNVIWSDETEKEFRKFTKKCMGAIIQSVQVTRDSQFDSAAFKELFQHRYWGYGFFAAYEAERRTRQGQAPIMGQGQMGYDEELHKILYLSLTDFYKSCSGGYQDNEEAIKMICKYYPEKISFQDAEKEAIISALSRHLFEAGTPKDSGYAPNGIAMIEQYIRFLPEELVVMILCRQSFACLPTDAVYRHQIYAIVISSGYSKAKQRQYKFFFLDSGILLDVLEHLLFRKKRGRWKTVEWRTERLGEKKILFYVDENDEEYYLMSSDMVQETDEIRARRTLTGAAGREIFNIELETDIVVTFYGKKYHIEYNAEDWTLNHIRDRNFSEKFEMAVNNASGGTGRGISLQYVYCNGYRGMNRQVFALDGRYHYDADKRELSFDKGRTASFTGIYGKGIVTLACIVGQNGVGKTSFVDFLCDVFLKVVSQLDTTNKSPEEIWKECGVREGEEFLVLFEYGGSPYVVTNIKGLKLDETSCFYEGNGILYHNGALSKIFYFSGKIDMGGIELEQAKKKVIVKQDFSEMADLQYRVRYLRVGERDEKGYNINKSLCYQIFFLRMHTEEELEGLLWEGVKKELFQLNIETYQGLFQKMIKKDTIIKKEEEEDVRSFLCDGRVVIRYFSSGQYEKFAFLSKLFWIVGGYEEFERIIHMKKAANAFAYDEIIKECDSVLLFIDEGDLYYHPEWQREYISILLRVLQKKSDNSRVQIIVSTNSPFILSDILPGNITYIPERKDCPESTFGQNIHTLLKHNFFMKYTIGEFARREIIFWLEKLGERDVKIKNLIDNVNEHFQVNFKQGQEVYTFLRRFIEGIGEEVYRYKLLDLLEKVYVSAGVSELERLVRERERLDERIRKIEEKTKPYDTDD